MSDRGRRKGRRDDTLGFGLRVEGGDNPFSRDFISEAEAKKMRHQKTASQDPSQVVTNEERRNLKGGDEGMPVAFPENFYPPVNSTSFDPRKLINVPAGTRRTVLQYTAEEGQSIVILKYGLFTDALDADLVEFKVTIDGKKVLRYHGDPSNNFRLSLSLGANLNENNMIPCNLYLKPRQTIKIEAINNDAVDVPMGARLSGYVDSSIKRKSRSFGG